MLVVNTRSVTTINNNVSKVHIHRKLQRETHIEGQ